MTRPGPPDDVDATLAQIAEDLGDDGVYVHPELASGVTDEQLDAIVDNLEANPVPTFVVLYPFRDGDPFSGNPQDLVARLHEEEFPEPGQYLTTDRSLQYSTSEGVSLDGRAYDVAGTTDGEMYGDAFTVLRYEDVPSVGAAAERLTSLLLEPPDEVAEAAEEARDDYLSSSGSGGGSDGDADDGAGFDATGVLVALVVAAVVGGLGWAAVRRGAGSRTSAPRGRARSFALPPSAIDRIREAHDRRLEAQAREELLALGEAVDATEIGPRHDRDAWQAALDHYDAARRVLDLDDDSDVLDVVGALVLARRGRAALSSATSGRRWVPPVSCYLNPLHGDAAGEERLTAAGRDDAHGHETHDGVAPRPVPVCSACRAALRGGKVPDTLDVVHRGAPAHYFETDVEPWASTGYGSLERDLVTALQRTRR